MTLQGAARHSQRLAKLAKGADQLPKVLFAAGDYIRVQARQSISRGTIRGKGHIPSRPGEPPKGDTGNLESNITTEMTGPLTVQVRAHASYAAALEYGTSKIAERPFMRPAVKAAQPKIKDFVTVTVKRMVQES